MANFLTKDLDTTDGYKLLLGLIVPRPIGWIGSRSADGVNNLAPFSFFGAVCANPPTVVFGASRAARRDTTANVLDTGVFTVNIVTSEVIDKVVASAAPIPSDTDEFDHAGLTPVMGTEVNAPMVGEARARLECRLSHHVQLGEDHGTDVIFGEIVAYHVDDDLLDGTRIDQAGLHAVGSHVANTYSRISDFFTVD